MKTFILTWNKTFPEDEINIVVPRRDLDRIQAELPITIKVHGGLIPQHGLNASMYLPFLAGKLGIDKVLSHNFAGLWGTRFYVFVHDALFVDSPQWFTWSERQYFKFMRATWRRAQKVLTSSNCEARRLMRLQRSNKTVEAVGLAVDGALKASAPTRPSQLIPGGRFVLSVGRLNVRKNTQYVVDVCRESAIISSANPLVIVGEPDGPSAGSGFDNSLIESGSIVFLGHVSDSELAWLYSNAHAFFFLSRDEGFGLPPLEAASFGCPVYVSDIPVMREVTRDLNAVYLPLDSLSSASEIVRSSFANMPRSIGNGDYTWPRSVKAIRQAMMTR